MFDKISYILLTDQKSILETDLSLDRYHLVLYLTDKTIMKKICWGQTSGIIELVHSEAQNCFFHYLKVPSLKHLKEGCRS